MPRKLHSLDYLRIHLNEMEPHMRYTTITLTEMREMFAKKTMSGQGWTEFVVGKEVVFDYEFTNGCFIRVFSSIRTGANQARANGVDAIKVCAINARRGWNDVTGIVKAKRVLRVEGWRDNLGKAIREVHGIAKERLQTLFA